jgi:hypothetical protein
MADAPERGVRGRPEMFAAALHGLAVLLILSSSMRLAMDISRSVFDVNLLQQFRQQAFFLLALA